MKIVTLLLLASLSASAAPLDARVTVQVKDAPLTTFLDTMSAQAKVNFILTEGFEDKRVSLDVKDVAMSAALRSILEPAGLAYRRLGQGRTYLIARKGARAGGAVEIKRESAALRQPVTVRIKNAPLKTLFETISAEAKLNFTLEPGLDERKATIGLENVPVRDLLETLAEVKKLRIRETGKDTFSVAAMPQN